MPKIQFDNLPLEIGRHLAKRIRRRQLSVDDLDRLRKWVQTRPEAPPGDWWKDFGSFKLCGTGAWPKTVLTGDMEPRGEEIK